MSTSVLLEGSLEGYDTEQPNWKGVWRFAKDKKGSLDFSYEVSFFGLSLNRICVKMCLNRTFTMTLYLLFTESIYGSFSRTL